MRTRDRPAEAMFGSHLQKLVFLCVVKIVPRDAWQVFVKGGLHGLRRIVVEGSKVVLEARHQCAMTQLPVGCKRLKAVANHQAVHAAILSLVILAAPGAEE